MGGVNIVLVSCHGCFPWLPPSVLRQPSCLGGSNLVPYVWMIGSSVAKVRRNRQTCGVNLSGTTKCEVTTPHSQLFVMQCKFYENENFTLK